MHAFNFQTTTSAGLLRYCTLAAFSVAVLVGSQTAFAQLPTIELNPNTAQDSPIPDIDLEGLNSLNPSKSQPLISPDQLPSEIRNQLGLADSASSNVSAEAVATDTSLPAAQPSLTSFLSSPTDQLTSPEGLTSSIKVALILATLSLAPAIVLMTTCYVRVIVVLTLLKQAFGAQQLPPTQVLTALSLFVTLLIMTPVWNEVKQEAIDPYTQTENGISWEEAWTRGIAPVKTFMAKQIEAAGNAESIAVFYKYIPEYSEAAPTSAQEIPINVLLPAFMVSELKVAFLLGFQIFLPFLVLDLVVSSVTVSTGMLMLPPTMVSFPLKLILFVLVDGWNLVVGMLLQSFIPIT
ncbi:MAG: flagellar type III secretion system pore protein FliP [Pirellulales bacterium]